MDRPLTPKQEMFCLKYLETGSAAEAYRLAYDVSRMKPENVHVRAAEVKRTPKVKARIAELQRPAQEAAMLSLENHLKELEKLRDLAMADKQYSSAVAAETNRGKVSGLYVDKVEHKGNLTVVVQKFSDADSSAE